MGLGSIDLRKTTGARQTNIITIYIWPILINSDSGSAQYNSPEPELNTGTTVNTNFSEHQPLNSAQAAKMMGYEGDACPECGAFTLVRNGTCLKCDTCGASTGCS